MTTVLTPSRATLSNAAASVEFGVIDADGVTTILEDLQGWGSPRSTRQLTQRPRSHGAWAGEAYLAPRDTLALTVTLMSDDPAALLRKVDQTYTAAGLTDTTLSVVETDGRTRSCIVGRQDEIIPTWISDEAVTLSIQLAAPDPRKYGDQFGGPSGVSTHLPMSSGGLTFPITFPITFPATVVTGQIGIDNPGNVESPIRMRIDGPCTGPIISHIALGRQLVFSSSYTVAAGNWLDIRMGGGRELSVLENGQASRNGYITSRGAFGLDPGNNNIGFNAAVYDAASLLTVYAAPAWM